MSENLIFCRNQRLGRHSDKICYESPTKKPANTTQFISNNIPNWPRHLGYV